MLVCNLLMFAFAAFKLHSMRRRVQGGCGQRDSSKRASHLGRSISTAPLAEQESAATGESAAEMGDRDTLKKRCMRSVAANLGALESI